MVMCILQTATGSEKTMAVDSGCGRLYRGCRRCIRLTHRPARNTQVSLPRRRLLPYVYYIALLVLSP